MSLPFNGFSTFEVNTGDVVIRGQRGGNGPVALLIHGFPQSQRIWRKIAEDLKSSFTVVCLDLRGYGESSKPKPVGSDHHTYSKRVMAEDCIKVLDSLGHGQVKFYLLAHDRGARVGHRLAVDYEPRVIKAMFLDIAPTLAMYEQTSTQFAAKYFHWFFLIQPFPFPENLIAANPKGFYGPGLAMSAQEDADYYVETAGSDYDCITAQCEDYRASFTIDLDHDREDIKNGLKTKVPLRVLWGKKGVVEKCFEPLKLWEDVATNVSGKAVDCGHYIPEELPGEVIAEFRHFAATK